MADRGIASTARASAAPAAHAAAPSKYERLIAEAKRSAVAKAIVVHPCDETSLRGAVEAAAIGLISASARVPIVLTSRADSVRSRMASCAAAVLYAAARRKSASITTA